MPSGALVLIASADTSLRRWWRQSLGDGFLLEEIDDSVDVKNILADRKPSVMILDLALPRLGGVKGIASLATASATTKIIALVDNEDHNEAVATLKAGAHGYCAREMDSGLARKAVEAVRNGELWVKRSVMLTLLRELIPTAAASTARGDVKRDARLRPLTTRERQIAYLVGDGARNKDIAASLNITETTVKAHLTAIFRKLGIPDRLRLALMLTEAEGSGRPKRTDRSGKD